jgi:choline dehydrogenase-like flavoprotein
MNKTTRVVIVGSGVAGAVIASELLARGVGPITMLEAGPKVEMRRRRTWLDMVMANLSPYAQFEDLPEEVATTGESPWAIKGGRLFGRGGSTLHWGGWCPRLKPEDFHLYSAAGKGLDWPFDYNYLEPYYCRAETLLQIAGDSHAKTHPLRSKPYPFEAAPFTQTDGVVIDALRKMGVSYEHMPIARNTLPINGMPACVTIGTCTYCPIGARYSADQTLNRIERYRNFHLLLNSPVRRILMRNKKEALGVEYVSMSTGASHVVDAETVILCAGALETPKLLMASTSEFWKAGIGNDADQVGRNLVAHPYLSSQGSKQTNPRKLQQELNFATLCSRHFDTPEEQATGKFFMNKAYTAPEMNLAKLMNQGLTTDAIEKAVTGTHVFELQGAIEPFSNPENRVMLGDGFNRFGVPKTKISTPYSIYNVDAAAKHLDKMKEILNTMGYDNVNNNIYPQRGDHAMSTCRMSASDANGVVDANLKIHGTDNLFICSNAVFPSASASNPTLTLIALALRFTDQFGSPDVGLSGHAR